MRDRRLPLSLVLLALTVGCGQPPTEVSIPVSGSQARASSAGRGTPIPRTTTPRPRATPSRGTASSTPASPGVATSPAASGTVGVTPSLAATGTVSTAPSQQGGTTQPSSTAGASGSPPPGSKPLLLTGTVHDEAGLPVGGATVAVRSLDTTVPYEKSAQTAEGFWSLRDAPNGVNLEVTVTKAGYTSRKQVKAFQSSPGLVNFGSPGEDVGAPFFISDRPEIASTAPAQGELAVAPGSLAYAVTLSEPLDATSRDVFERAFHLLPASGLAGAPAPNLVALETAANAATDDGVAASLRPLTGFAYTVTRGSAFELSAVNRATTRWNEAGTVMTLSFPGPLRSDDETPIAYQAALFAPEGGGQVKDASGKVLGTDGTGAATWPAAGPVYNVFKAENLTGRSWGETHHTAVGFRVRVDLEKPNLVGLEVTPVEANLRLTLRFSEPMAAYGKAGLSPVGARVFRLSSYTFGLARSASAAAGLQLQGTLDAPLVDLDTAGVEGLRGLLQEGVPFSFAAVESLGDWKAEEALGLGVGKVLEETQGGAVSMRVNPDDPTRVELWIRDGATLFAGFTHLRARASGLKDPAGNEVTASLADQHVVTAPL